MFADPRRIAVCGDSAGGTMLDFFRTDGSVFEWRPGFSLVSLTNPQETRLGHHVAWVAPGLSGLTALVYDNGDLVNTVAAMPSLQIAARRNVL